MNRNYLKITPEDEGVSLGYTMRMLENNDIEGLLNMHSVNINNRVSYLYDLSGRIPLEEMYLTREFTAGDIGYVAGFVKEMTGVAEKYMLDMDGIVFDIKYIFCSVSECSWELVYNPVMAGDARTGLKRLFEFILSRLDHRDHNAVVLGYGLYKRICQEEIAIESIFDNVSRLVEEDGGEKAAVYEATGLKYEVKDRINNDVIPEYIPEEREVNRKLDIRAIILPTVALSGVLAVLVTVFWGVVQAIFTSILLLLVIIILYRRFGNKSEICTSKVVVPYTTTYTNIEPVVVADKDSYKEEPTMMISGGGKLFLRRLVGKGEPGEEFTLGDSPLSIGSSPQSDLVIKDRGISRLHARISREGEMVFIKDMNSTNGTWVNERRLTVYELCPLKNGDVIRLAESRFELIDTSD